MPDSPSQDVQLPPIDGVLTMFYYDDLAAAADWYDRVLGFDKILISEGLALFRIHAGSQLALVGKGYGSQRPISGANKGAILSIQTRALRQWHERISSRLAGGAGQGLHRGGNGRTIEFKVRDPEGYTIEFFEWID